MSQKLVKLPESTVEGIAEMLKALAEPTRLKIMQYLHSGEACVGDIVEALEIQQANTSKHLKVLAQADLIASRKEGTTVYYQVASPFVNEMCNAICGSYQKFKT